MDARAGADVGAPRPRWRVTALASLAGLVGCTGDPRPAAAVRVGWRGEAFEDLSGAAVAGRFLVVCNDEARHSVHVLEQRDGGYAYHGAVWLTADGRELDLEVSPQTAAQSTSSGRTGGTRTATGRRPGSSCSGSSSVRTAG